MSKYDFIDDARWFRPYVDTEEFKKEIGGVDKNDWLVSIHRAYAEVFDETASKFPDRDALVFKEKRFTFKQLQNRVNSFAKGLLKMGVKKGDHVGLLMDNHDDYIIASLACWKLGAWLTAIDARYRKFELEYALQYGEISTLIMDPDTGGGSNDVLGMLKDLCPELNDAKTGEIESKNFPYLKNIICRRQEYPFAYCFEQVVEMGKDWAQDSQLAKAQSEVRPEDVLQMQFTSGTTGRPKGALQGNMAQYAAFNLLALRCRYTEKDRVIQLLPLNTALATVPHKLMAAVGCCCILQDLIPRYSPEETLRLVQEEKATAIIGAPAIFNMVLACPNFDQYDISSLTGGASAGAIMPPETSRGIILRLGMKNFVNWWAQTESSWVGITTKIDDPIEVRAEYIGTPVANTVAKICDPKTGQEVPRETEGELWLHDTYEGVGCMIDYYKLPEKSAQKRTLDGWIRSEDLCIMNEDGYIKITGRLVDLILVGGRNIYPAEIENFLQTLPYVANSAIIAVPNERLGEVPLACIELKQGYNVTEREVMRAIEKNLAPYKCPEYVRIFTNSSEWPLTASGKIQKFKLTERFTKELWLEEVAKKSAFVGAKKDVEDAK